jgi:hypothetical protein
VHDMPPPDHGQLDTGSLPVLAGEGVSRRGSARRRGHWGCRQHEDKVPLP